MGNGPHLIHASLSLRETTIQTAYLEQFSRFCRAHTESTRWACSGTSIPLKVAPSHGNCMDLYLRASLGHFESIAETALRSVQPFLATVCKTVRSTLSVRCLSVLSVCHVCDVGALWPNGWMHKDKTWHAGRPRPRTYCVRWGPIPSPKGTQRLPILGPYLLWPNGWMDQDGTLHGGRPQPRRLCVRWGPTTLPKRGAEPFPQFSAHFYCGQTVGCIKMPLGMELSISPEDFVLDGNPPLPENGAESPQFLADVYCAQRLEGSRRHLAYR